MEFSLCHSLMEEKGDKGGDVMDDPPPGFNENAADRFPDTDSEEGNFTPIPCLLGKGK